MTPAAFEPTRKAIETFIAANITLPFPVEWEGGRAVTTGATPAAWGKWFIVQGSTLPATIGEGHIRCQGILYLLVFLPEHTGLAKAYSAADLLASKLDRLQLTTPTIGTAYSNITFRTVSMTDGGNDKGYLQKNLSCIFQRDTYS